MKKKVKETNMKEREREKGKKGIMGKKEEKNKHKQKKTEENTRGK